MCIRKQKKKMAPVKLYYEQFIYWTFFLFFNLTTNPRAKKPQMNGRYLCPNIIYIYIQICSCCIISCERKKMEYCLEYVLTVGSLVDSLPA